MSESPSPAEDLLRETALDALREVIDPELGINIVDLGLVYGIDVEGSRAEVRLTMTTPACPLGEQIARDAEERVSAVDGIDVVNIALVWDPPWSAERMSLSAKSILGW